MLVLRIAVAGEFVGHGTFALLGKAEWVAWLAHFGLPPWVLTGIGCLDVTVALVVLLHPVQPILLWAIFWGFCTALVRPLVGLSWLEFVERWTNWGAPLALWLLRRRP